MVERTLRNGSKVRFCDCGRLIGSRSQHCKRKACRDQAAATQAEEAKPANHPTQASAPT